MLWLGGRVLLHLLLRNEIRKRSWGRDRTGILISYSRMRLKVCCLVTANTLVCLCFAENVLVKFHAGDLRRNLDRSLKSTYR